MNKFILSGALSVALIAGVAGCGVAKSTSNTTATTKTVTNTTNSTSTSVLNSVIGGPTGTKGAPDTTGTNSSVNPILNSGSSSTGSSQSVPGQQTGGVKLSQPIPGAQGDNMQKVLNAVLQDPQVMQILANNQGKKLKISFPEKNGNSTAVNGVWNVQLLLDGKEAARINVDANTFKVLSVTTIK